MLDEKWLGCHIVSESPSKKFLGFLLEDSKEPDVLHLNFYSDAYNKYSHETVCSLYLTNLVTLVANSENNENLLKNYLVENLPPQYKNRPHTFFIPETLMLTILADVNLLDMDEQTFPDYEEDSLSIYFSDEESEYYIDDDDDFCD